MRIRIVQRDHIAGGKAALIRVIAIVLSFLVAAILLGVMGYNPWQAFGSLFKSAFGSMSNIRTIITAIPLIIISLGWLLRSI